MTASLKRHGRGASAWRILALAPALLAMAGLSGCMQVEAVIKLNEDGSGTLTERMRFSRELLDRAGAQEGELLKQLGKEEAQERMKHLGKGVTLVRHEVRDAEGGSKESIAEFQIGDINDLQYVSPWLSFTDYATNNAIKCQVVPVLVAGGYVGAGQLQITFSLLKGPKGPEDGKDPKKPEKGPGPLEQ